MATRPYTMQKMRDTKGPLDNPPTLKNYTSNTITQAEKVQHQITRYKYGSKGVKKTEVPKYAFGIGSIMGLFGKGGSGGGGLGSLFGGGGGGGIGSLFGKGGASGAEAGASAGAGGGKFNMNSAMEMMKSQQGGGGTDPNKDKQPQQPHAVGQEAPSDPNRVEGNVMNGMPNPKDASRGVPGGGGSGGVAANIPGYGQFIQIFDKKLDEQAAALAPLNEQGTRLNKYKKGSASIKKMEGGTPFYTGTEDMGGIVHFQKKNPLHKWDGVGKTMQLASQMAAVLNQQADKYTGGMATKGTNNIASMGAAVGNTTIGDKDYGGSAGNQAPVKQAENVQAPQVVNPNEGYKLDTSQSVRAEQQTGSLMDKSVNTANVPPLTPLTTPNDKRANTGGLFSNKSLFKQGLIEGGLKKGTAKLKFKSPKK